MRAMGKSLVFFVIHCLPFVCCNEKRNNYLVMKAGNGSIFTHLWSNSVGGFNVGDGTKHLWSVPQVAADGNFRSPLIDSWDSDTPDKIYFSFFNHYGNELFWISFNGSGSNSNISSWMHPSRVIGSSHDIMDSNLDLLYPISYPVYGADLASSGVDAWFAVWGGSVFPLLKYYPVFLFSNRKDSAYPLSSDPRLTTYLDCYDNSIETHIMSPGLSEPLTIERCNAKCDDFGVNLMLLEKGSTCYCGVEGSTSKTTVNISYCTGPCAGNPEQTICGLVDKYYAMYIADDVSTDTLPTVPEESVEIMSSTVYSVTGSDTIEFNLTQHLQGKNHVYVTGISATSTTVIGITVLYNFLPACDMSKAKVLENNATETVFPTNGTYNDIGIIKTSCLYITSASFISLHPVSVNISLFGPTSNFIQAPVLAIIGAWTKQETTTAEDIATTEQLTTTSIADTTTSETTTDSTTLTTETTSETTTDSTTLTTETTPETTTDSTTLTTETSEKTTTDMLSTVMSTQTTSVTSQNTATTTPEYTEVSTQPTSLTSGDTATTTPVSTATHSDNNDECPSCNCNYIIDLSINMTTELVMKLEQIKKNLTVNRKLLSSYIRSKTSAKDTRPSSAGIGYVGIIVLCVVGTCILLNDMTSFYSIFKLKMDKIKQWHNGLI